MFGKQILSLLYDILPSADNLQKLLVKSENDDHGDYSLPCFQLAKILQKSPNHIAENIVAQIEANEWLEKCENVNGYVNFFVNKEIFCMKVIEEIFEKNSRYGSSYEGDGKTCLVEHTSINPNASPHIGRARNAVIGDFITRLMKFEGYNVNVHYFVNDIGKQISMLVLGSQGLDNVEFDKLLELYVSINRRIIDDKEVEKQVFDLLYKLENGDENVRKQFRNIVNICIAGQTKIFNSIGINYDSFDYESEFLFDNSLNIIIDKLKEVGMLFEDPSGRYVINLEKYDLPPLVVTRGDKTSLYPLRDIAYTIWKCKLHVDKNLIVLGQDQQLYFKQIATILKELGYIPPEVVHYAFVLLVEGKMSTRGGTVVLLEDFMNETVSKVREEVAKRRDNADENRAQKIAYCAVKYSMEKTSNDRNVIFDWNSALSFEGDSGPYLLYSYVRINSILNKCSVDEVKEYNFLEFTDVNEITLVKTLSYFPDVIAKAKHEYSPHIIANYAFELARRFSAFYAECSVINAETDRIKCSRIKLILACKQVLENIFNILGIDTVEHM